MTRPILGLLADLTVHDERGRCRCPKCGRYCRIEDFAVAGVAVVHVPRCGRCRAAASEGRG